MLRPCLISTASVRIVVARVWVVIPVFTGRVPVCNIQLENSKSSDNATTSKKHYMGCLGMFMCWYIRKFANIQGGGSAWFDYFILAF